MRPIKIDITRNKTIFYCRVTGVKCGPDGIPLASLSLTSNPASFSFDPPSNSSFGRSPLLRDPLDARNVEVRLSHADADAGDGVFALRLFSPGDTVCYFSALKFTRGQFDQHRRRCHYDRSRSDEERRACAKYSVELESVLGATLVCLQKISTAMPRREFRRYLPGCFFGIHICCRIVKIGRRHSLDIGQF